MTASVHREGMNHTTFSAKRRPAVLAHGIVFVPSRLRAFVLNKIGASSSRLRQLGRYRPARTFTRLPSTSREAPQPVFGLGKDECPPVPWEAFAPMLDDEAVEDMVIVTADGAFAAYSVKLWW